MQEIITATCVKDDEQPEYNNSMETGLIRDNGKVPPTGGVV